MSLVFLMSSLDSFRPIQVLNRPESGAGDREQNLQVELEGRKYPFSFSLLEMPMDERESPQDRLIRQRTASDRLV